MYTISKIIYKLTTIFTKKNFIPQIIAIYSTTYATLLFLTTKLYIRYTTQLTFFCIHMCISLLLLFTLEYSFDRTVVDVCNFHNISINQGSEITLPEITGKPVNENLDKISEDFINSNISSKNYKKITPADFYTNKNFYLAFSISIILICCFTYP